MLKATKQPGTFIDTILVPKDYKEVEDTDYRKFVKELTFHDIKESCSHDTVYFPDDKGLIRRAWCIAITGIILQFIARILARFMYWSFGVLERASDKLYGIGRRLEYKAETLLFPEELK